MEPPARIPGRRRWAGLDHRRLSSLWPDDAERGEARGRARPVETFGRGERLGRVEPSLPRAASPRAARPEAREAREAATRGAARGRGRRRGSGGHRKRAGRVAPEHWTGPPEIWRRGGGGAAAPPPPAGSLRGVTTEAARTSCRAPSARVTPPRGWLPSTRGEFSPSR